MRKLAILLFTLAPFWVLAQDSTLLTPANAERIAFNRDAMWVLGGWAAGNIAISGVLRFQTEGTTRYFHEMNAIWNFVNAGLAGGALIGLAGTDPGQFDLWQTLNEQQKLERLLLFNAGLDVGYITAGFYLRERSRRPALDPTRRDRLAGYGSSLWLQGGFLLVFDLAVWYLAHRQGVTNLPPLLEQLSVGPGGLTLRF